MRERKRAACYFLASGHLNSLVKSSHEVFLPGSYSVSPMYTIEGGELLRREVSVLHVHQLELLVHERYRWVAHAPVEQRCRQHVG